MAEELDRARGDPQVKALLIKINSPGGSAAVADMIYHQIWRYRQETGVKIVANLMEVGASGGYYIALTADYITALPTTLTGSIGVVSLRLDLSRLMDKVGVEAEAVTSGRLKDMWSPFRPSTDEERRIMQSIIDEGFQQFRSLLIERRPDMTPDQIERAATARIFSASQALELGLIDAIAYPDEAFEAAMKAAGLEKARLVAYHRPQSYRANIYSPAVRPAVSLSTALSLASAPRLMYLWLPGLPVYPERSF
jgi:protease-4